LKYYETNADAVKADQEKDKKEAEERDNNVARISYTLKNGRTTMRVLPAFGEDGVWYRKITEYYFPVEDGHLFLTSPRDFGLPDPLYDYQREVYEDGNEAAIKEAKRFRAKKRFLMNVLVLSDTKGTTMADGVKVLKAPTTVHRGFVDFDTDAEYGDITHPEKGFNMIIDREGEKLSTEYTVKAQRERTNIFEIVQNGGIDVATLSLHDLDDYHRSGVKSEEELREILEDLKGEMFRAQEKAAAAPVMSFPRPVQTTIAPPETAPPVSGPVMTPVMKAEDGAVQVPVVPMPPQQEDE
jgi:hypothetical protein